MTDCTNQILDETMEVIDACLNYKLQATYFLFLKVKRGGKEIISNIKNQAWETAEHIFF